MKYTREKLGRSECPYIERWMLDFGPFSIRLHHWIRSDDKRNPHDHPWWFATLVLSGSYEDWAYPVVDGVPSLDDRRVDTLRRGSIRFRSANHVHSVAVRPGGCWSLLVMGKPGREWGFWVRRALDGAAKFKKANKYFYERGHHPCDQP